MVDPLDVAVVRTLRDALRVTLGRRLVGVSVYGSLATGAFEADVSDVDLIVVLTDEPDPALLPQLEALHAGIVRRHPRWTDRLDIDCISVHGLATCRVAPSRIARTSPGEPLHLTHAGREFLLDWYPARRDGVALFGPPLASLIPPIPEAEYLAEARAYLNGFRGRFDRDASAGSQAYAILTMCRAHYAFTERAHLSKREAALRARADLSEWAATIDRALGWRDRQWDAIASDASAWVAETGAFVTEFADRLAPLTPLDGE